MTKSLKTILLSWLIVLVSCGMYDRRDEDIGKLRKYDAEIERVNRQIESLGGSSEVDPITGRSHVRDSLVMVRAKLEESRKYLQIRAGSEVQQDWDARKPCMDAPNQCPPNKTSQRK